LQFDDKPVVGVKFGVDPGIFQKLFHKRKRYLRHAVSLYRYGSFHKLRNLARVEWERLRQVEKVSGLPYVVVLDPTNVCNLKCPVCATPKGELTQPGGRISLDDFENFVDRIAPHTYRLILYNWGEPFLHRQIIHLIRHAHRRRISTSIIDQYDFNILIILAALLLVQVIGGLENRINDHTHAPDGSVVLPEQEIGDE